MCRRQPRAPGRSETGPYPSRSGNTNRAVSLVLIRGASVQRRTGDPTPHRRVFRTSTAEVNRKLRVESHLCEAFRVAMRSWPKAAGSAAVPTVARFQERRQLQPLLERRPGVQRLSVAATERARDGRALACRVAHVHRLGECLDDVRPGTGKGVLAQILEHAGVVTRYSPLPLSPRMPRRRFSHVSQSPCRHSSLRHSNSQAAMSSGTS